MFTDTDANLNLKDEFTRDAKQLLSFVLVANKNRQVYFKPAKQWYQHFLILEACTLLPERFQLQVHPSSLPL